MPDPIYVAARRALLDLLDGLGPQRAAVILVGAQAVYLHTGEADFAISPFTKDADLVVDRNRLLDRPILTEALARSGFVPGVQPGIWLAADRAQVDLLVPAALAGTGRRGARLGPPHGDRVARKAKGLEGAVVDHAPRLLTALDAADSRRFEIEVAGPAALLVAKLHKLAERAADVRRSADKDALDIFRLLRQVSTEELAGGARRLALDPVSAEVTLEALRYLGELFGTPVGSGTVMVVRSLEGLEDDTTVAASSTALTQDLLAAVRA
jgi:hypothetical protein